MSFTRVAVVQAAPIAFDRQRTLEKTRDLAVDAAGRGARLIVFPEAFVYGYPRGVDFAPGSGRERPTGVSFSADTDSFATPKCTRKKLIEALAPTPKPTVIPVAETPAPTAPVAEGETAAGPAKPAEPKAPEPTPEQTAVMVDLHWLIHQGAVLEFADGRMETAKKPVPKPVKQEKKAEVKPAVEGETAVATEAVAETEVASPVEAAPVAEATETVAPAAEVSAPTEAPPAPAATAEVPAPGETTPAA